MLFWVQANAYDQEKVDWLVQNCPTCIEIFQGLCEIYAERPMFGFCTPGSDEWQTISYKQVYERVVHFAAGGHLSPWANRDNCTCSEVNIVSDGAWTPREA